MSLSWPPFIDARHPRISPAQGNVWWRPVCFRLSYFIGTFALKVRPKHLSAERTRTASIWYAISLSTSFYDKSRKCRQHLSASEWLFSCCSPLNHERHPQSVHSIGTAVALHSLGCFAPYSYINQCLRIIYSAETRKRSELHVRHRHILWSGVALILVHCVAVIQPLHIFSSKKNQIILCDSLYFACIAPIWRRSKRGSFLSANLFRCW